MPVFAVILKTIKAYDSKFKSYSTVNCQMLVKFTLLMQLYPLEEYHIDANYICIHLMQFVFYSLVTKLTHCSGCKVFLI